MSHSIGGLIVACFALALAGHAAALDGERKGFMFDFGLGGSYISDEFTTLQTDNTGGSAATFNIGYGVSNQLMIYLGGRSGAWSSFFTDEIASIGVGAIGATFYFSETAPSGYINGVVGSANYDNGQSADGSGFSLGVGYEWIQNWSLGADYTLGQISGLNTHVIALKINHHWY
jgi:hypothetical protein